MAEKLPSQIQLEIVTPARQHFAGPVEAVTVPGREGYLGILPGHAPLLSELKVGIITYRAAQQEQRLFCGWGFVEVLPDRVSILAEVVEEASAIDVARAASERDQASARLRARDPETDFVAALQEWEAAVARLEVASRQ